MSDEIFKYFKTAEENIQFQDGKIVLGFRKNILPFDENSFKLVAKENEIIIKTYAIDKY